MINFVVILALFALYVAPAQGIKCYMCRTDNSAQGRKQESRASDADTLAMMLALGASPMCKEGAGKKFDCPNSFTVCAKLEIDGEVTRMCSDGTTGCNTKGTIKACQCDTDLCNAVPLQRSPSMILLGAVGVLTVLFNALASRLN